LSALTWAWLGQVPYGEALLAQRARRAAIQRGEQPEVLWLLEHPPTVTTGRRPAPGTPDAAELAAQGVALFATERGGLATFHGPGQLVCYVLVDLARRGFGVRRLVCLIEDAVISWLAGHDIAAARRPGLPGIWAQGDKVCAIGLHVQRGVTLHGLALNLDPDLSQFNTIVPCGITDAGVTSLARLAGAAPSPETAAQSLAESLIEVFGADRALRKGPLQES
jgi:lipoyl(octanoyl) transferase